MATRFLAELAKLAYPSIIHCTTFQNGLQDLYAYAKRLNSENPFTSIRPVAIEFTRLECIQQASISRPTWVYFMCFMLSVLCCILY